MSITIGLLREQQSSETRVATTPAEIKKLSKFGITFWVEHQAGVAAGFTDQQYLDQDAAIVDRDKVLEADILLVLRLPSTEDLERIKPGALLIGLLEPFANLSQFTLLASRGVNAISVELIPRISRAQSMDALSSQANIAGYRAVIEALHHYGRFVPLMMTAAGTARPAKIVVLGVGVAGLQAIATARRLGGQVEAFDVRPETREQVLSLGARFIDIDLEEQGSGEGGYARELSDQAKQRQQSELVSRLQQADIIITTALIPGKPAPVLVTEEAVKGMRAGSVIVDMAAANGGNCPLSEPDKVVTRHGVVLIGETNLPGLLPADASNFYGRNLSNLLELLLSTDESGATQIGLDLEDEIIDGCLLVFEGKLRH
ncbi:MAG: Re/Si-specific NAD(P)(+) transhydrogenase subunit alpha [Immundisolibacteraceae bacterium]|nr:Re/Si-specific NAD(P)(+) transhydrogenase subunit alpha [Immundisolibacteraceae bacterium]